jgi:hypothetical protein
VIALVAALVGGFSEAIARNNEARAHALRRARPRVRSLRELEGYGVEGAGEALGDVVDAYFDDHTWTIRYLMVAVAGPTPRRMLLSPHSVRGIDRRARVLLAALTAEQVQASPEFGESPSISRPAEIALLKYYGFPYYWTGSRRWSDDDHPRPLMATAATAPPVLGKEEVRAVLAPDAHLRSVRDFRRYAIHASDGEFGHVDDVLVDPRSWAVRYIVVDTRRWWPGARVVLAPEWVSYVSWVERSVHVDLDRATIRSAPPYQRARLIDRAYEARLRDHYGQPRYRQGHVA